MKDEDYHSPIEKQWEIPLVLTHNELLYSSITSAIPKIIKDESTKVMKEISSLTQGLKTENGVTTKTTNLQSSQWIHRVILRTCDITDKVNEQFDELTIFPVNRANNATNIRPILRRR